MTDAVDRFGGLQVPVMVHQLVYGGLGDPWKFHGRFSWPSSCPISLDSVGDRFPDEL